MLYAACLGHPRLAGIALNFSLWSSASDTLNHSDDPFIAEFRIIFPA